MMRRAAVLWALALGSLAPGPALAEAPCAADRLDLRWAGGGESFTVEVADDAAERSRGLMFRESLDPAAGMLFVYESPRRASFWMKNTLIPLDIIYIQADGTVLSIARNTTPLSEAPIPSGGPVVGVLELAGGRAAEIGLLPGDKIEHRIFKRG